MSWSQYPLDETLERAYCSEYFGEVSASSLHIYKEAFGNSAGGFGNTSAAGSTRVATVSAAMALGAGRAAGIIPQFSAAQAFNRVKTSILPTPTGSASLDFSFSKHSEAQPKPCNSPTKLFSQCVTDLGIPTTMVLEPEQFSTAFGFHGPAPSLPSSQVENPSIIPVIGACGVTVKSISSKYSKHFELQVSDENIGRDGLTGLSELNALTTARSDEDEPQTVGMSYINSRTASNMLSRNISSLKNKSESTVSAADEHYLEPNYSYTSGSRASGAAERVQASDPRERPVQHGLRKFNTPDQTETSSGRAEDADFRGARTQRSTTPLYRRDVSELENQSTDCQFNENQNAFIEQNKLESKRIRSKPSKRRRTAEVHNLSERRRRDKINEKMRALQDLVPNSNKTDKASMLDEAIEYLKALQLQLQLMSMRTGMPLPPGVVPTQMQYHLQCPPYLPMELGMAHNTNGITIATPMWPLAPSFPRMTQCQVNPQEKSRLVDAFNQSNLMGSDTSSTTWQYMDFPSQSLSMEAYNPHMMPYPKHLQRQYDVQQSLHFPQGQRTEATIQQGRQLFSTSATHDP